MLAFTPLKTCSCIIFRKTYFFDHINAVLGLIEPRQLVGKRELGTLKGLPKPKHTKCNKL